MTGMSMARRTRSGTGLGPGMCRKWRPWPMMTSHLPYPDQAWYTILHSFFGLAICILNSNLTSTTEVPQSNVDLMKSTIPESGVPIGKNPDEAANRAEASLHGEILIR